MSPTVSIIVPYFGDKTVWEPLVQRAVASAKSQSVECQVITSYADTLHEARNRGAGVASGKYLVFLDADDELDPFYVGHMLNGTGDVRQPSTIGVVDGVVQQGVPELIPKRPLWQSNYIVVGAMVTKDTFTAVGGFRDEPACEDWSLWARCWLAGAEITACPEAVYRVHVIPGSRNTTSDQYVSVFQRLRQEFLTQAQAKGLM